MPDDLLKSILTYLNFRRELRLFLVGGSIGISFFKFIYRLFTISSYIKAFEFIVSVFVFFFRNFAELRFFMSDNKRLRVAMKQTTDKKIKQKFMM